MTSARDLILRLSLLLAMGSLFSCKAPDNQGDIQISLSGSQFILIDAKAQSCKSRTSSTATDDVSALYADLGVFTVKWIPPSASAKLKIIYIKIYPRSSGLSSSDPKVIAGQDLNCLVSSSIDAPDASTLLPVALDAEGYSSSTFLQGHIWGDLTPTDATKRSSFSGRADVLVYALLQIPGEQDKPVTGRSSFNFQFDGVF